MKYHLLPSGLKLEMNASLGMQVQCNWAPLRFWWNIFVHEIWFRHQSLFQYSLPPSSSPCHVISELYEKKIWIFRNFDKLTLYKSEVFLLGPSASRFTNQISLCNLLISSSLCSVLRHLLRTSALARDIALDTPSLRMTSLGRSVSSLLNLPSIRICVVENFFIKELFGGRQLSQNGFNIVLCLLANFLGGEELFLVLILLIKGRTLQLKILLCMVIWWLWGCINHITGDLCDQRWRLELAIWILDVLNLSHWHASAWGDGP